MTNDVTRGDKDVTWLVNKLAAHWHCNDRHPDPDACRVAFSTIKALIEATGHDKDAPLEEEVLDLNEFSFRCKHCGERLIPEVDEMNDEEVLIEPCDCILDEQQPAAPPEGEVDHNEVKDA